jgi:DNA-binding beta-propeller fold protein YncE
VTAYVANYDSGTAIAINTTSAPISVGTEPGAIAITPNGETAHVANQLFGT